DGLSLTDLRWLIQAEESPVNPIHTLTDK
ncbi:MAG: hypothetical protein ACJARK_002558, partial [Marinobacter psychrophilus]